MPRKFARHLCNLCILYLIQVRGSRSSFFLKSENEMNFTFFCNLLSNSHRLWSFSMHKTIQAIRFSLNHSKLAWIELENSKQHWLVSINQKGTHSTDLNNWLNSRRSVGNSASRQVRRKSNTWQLYVLLADQLWIIGE